MDTIVVTTRGVERDSGPIEHGGPTRREGMRVKIDPIVGITERGLIPRGGFYFQCPPLEEFTIEHGHTHTDYETVLAGQMSRKGGQILAQATFDTLVVDWGLYTILKRPVDAEDFKKKLVRICEKGTPFLMTCAHEMPPGGYTNWKLTEAGPELQMPMTLRTLRVTEKAGEGDARYFNLAFTEYRDPVVQRRELGEKAPRAGDRVKLPLTGHLTKNGFFRFTDPDGQLIEIRGELFTQGDPIPYGITMSDLAKFFYRDPSMTRRIAKANDINWGATSVLKLHPRFKSKPRPKITIPKGKARNASEEDSQDTVGNYEPWMEGRD